ncbi:putative transmembrane protein [Candidatus Burkholderia pumila]|uniref:Transmembrane protein n=1 Tax=Candidatus Burkholderia pumila TaxID=1090375 RepID=A0ABR5HMY9_9BURK|nr:putative transmembrane protein [Candidatus Burkholderia pumila]
MQHRLFCMISMLWVGSLLTLGLVAAPVLFSVLDRESAGSVAAQLFRIEAIVGVVCALVLILIGNRFVKSGIVDYKRVRWIVAVMLLCVLVGYFALQPFMNAIRVAAQEAGTTLADSPDVTKFGVLHGISSAIYLIECLFGLALVWRLSGAKPVKIVPTNKSAKMAAKRARR